MSDGNSEEVPAAASLPQHLQDDPETSSLLPDPDEHYDFAASSVTYETSIDDDPTVFSKPGKKEGLEKGSSPGAEIEPQYILGTLVVRVVAARDLEPAQKSGGIGGIVFSGKGVTSKGAANPYASVKFGSSTQRTSEVYDSLDPIWPRQEAMFMDVTLPASKVAHPEVASENSSFEPIEIPSETGKKYEKPHTVLTVALFHAAEIGRANKMPTKGIFSGDSNDLFLGMASIDLLRLFTGRDHTFDGWLQLSGTESSRGYVRLVCEYEPSDPAPRPGDYCRFTQFCNPRDLYPLQCGHQYRVAETQGDMVIISYTTSEGWVCTFQAHRFMLICEERHHSTVEVAQDEFASMAERLAYSPLVHSINETVERVAVDGLLNVGEEVARKGLGLFNRWFSGGVDVLLNDVANATNWDGRYNPNASEDLDLPEALVSDDQEDGDPTNSGRGVQSRFDDQMDSKPAAISQVALPSFEPEPLPNMPSCPITGFPMIDPVVAADGHTYERSAIARWLTTSNMSPMTGSVLPHKELVTNYGLMSSVQEAATRVAAQAHESFSASAAKRDIPTKIEVDESASITPSGLFSLDGMETVTVSPAGHDAQDFAAFKAKEKADEEESD